MSITQFPPVTLAEPRVRLKGSQYMRPALLLSLVCFVLLTSLSSYGQGSPEAERQARAFWARKITKCGEDYYARWGSDRIIQFKGVSIAVTPQRISETDRLN